MTKSRILAKSIQRGVLGLLAAHDGSAHPGSWMELVQGEEYVGKVLKDGTVTMKGPEVFRFRVIVEEIK